MDEMEFSIICKENRVKFKFQGSIIDIAAIMAAIAARNENVNQIINLAAAGLNAIEKLNKLGEAREHTTNN